MLGRYKKRMTEIRTRTFAGQYKLQASEDTTGWPGPKHLENALNGPTHQYFRGEPELAKWVVALLLANQHPYKLCFKTSLGIQFRLQMNSGYALVFVKHLLPDMLDG